jgi:hypothetical protein
MRPPFSPLTCDRHCGSGRFALLLRFPSLRRGLWLPLRRALDARNTPATPPGRVCVGSEKPDVAQGHQGLDWMTGCNPTCRVVAGPDMLVQAPIRAPCSIAAHFGADRAEIRPAIGAITWSLESFAQPRVPSSPNPSFSGGTPHDVRHTILARRLMQRQRATYGPRGCPLRSARGQQAPRNRHSP